MHSIHLHPRQILCFFAVLMLWAAAGLWLLVSALQSEGDAWESSVRIGTEALAVSGATSRDWAGLLLDSAGRVLLAQPADLLDAVQDADAYVGALRVAAGGATQGWLDIDVEQGRFRRAYLSRTRQGGSWFALPPCRRLDFMCSPQPAWMGAAALALLVPAGLCMAWLARAMGSGPLPLSAREGACGERMQATGRLSGPFAHELNNQLGIIRNCAYLIQRIEDERLALPVQTVLKAVEAASALTQRLQRYGERGCARPQALELSHWLPRLQPALALLLGKRMALDIGVAPEAMQVHVDREGFELVLSCIMLGVRDVLADGAVVRLTAGFLGGAVADGLASGRQVQVCVEAWVSWLQEPAAPREGPQPALATGDDCDGCDGCGPLALAQDLCRSVGSEVWIRSQPGRCVVAVLVLPVRAEGAAPSA